LGKCGLSQKNIQQVHYEQGFIVSAIFLGLVAWPSRATGTGAKAGTV
jgi:hypothetical protein